MKKYPIHSFSGDFDVYPLELDGPNNVSTPRQVISVNTTLKTFKLGGNLLYRFVPGFVLDVSHSADGTIDGTYTVDTFIPTTLSINGLYDVKAPVVAASTQNLLLSGLAPMDGAVINVGDRVLAMGQTLSEFNGIYIANSGVWTRATDFDSQPEVNLSAVYVEQGELYGETIWTTTSLPVFTVDVTPINFTQHIGNVYTDVTVVEPIPAPTGSLGSITYTIPAHTSLGLPGINTYNAGPIIDQNYVGLLETFAGPTSPPNPLIGQQWYNTTSETFQRYVNSYGPAWTGDIDLDNYKIVFRDPENANSDIYVTANDGETGVSVTPQTSPTSGSSIFRVRSQDLNERLDVQHDGYVASTNSLWISGTTLANVLKGKLIVSTTKTATAYSVDVDGNVNIDTGDIQFDNQYGILSGTGKFLKSDATGNIWQMTGSFAVNSDDLYVDEATGRVGISTATPAHGLDVNTAARVRQTLEVDGLTTLHDNLIVDDNVFVGTDVLVVDSTTNRVGINKLIPAVPLDVVGDATVTGNVNVTGGNLAVDTNVLFADFTNNRVGINTATPSTAFQIIGDTTADGSLFVDTNVLVVDATGNFVGINKTVPTVPLDVVGAVNINGATSITGGNLTVDTNVLVVDATTNRIGINVLAPTVTLDVFGNANITGTTTMSGGNLVVDTDVLVVDSTNNRVGINKLVPTVALDVVGDTLLTGNVTWTGTTGMFTGTSTFTGLTSVTGGNFVVDTNVLVVDSTSNRVGINNLAPTVALDVVGDTLLTGNMTWTGPTGMFTGTSTFMGQTFVTGGNFIVDTDALVVDVTNNRVGINKVVPTVALDVVGNTLLTGTVATTGNVGIGTPSTAEALTVAGNVHLSAASPTIKFQTTNFSVGTGVAALVNNDVLLYNTTNSRWENVAFNKAIPTKSWAKVTGATGAILASSGITSVTRASAGVYTVVMVDTFASADNYVVSPALVSATPGFITYSGTSTTGFTINTFNTTSTATDYDFSFTVVGTL